MSTLKPHEKKCEGNTEDPIILEQVERCLEDISKKIRYVYIVSKGWNFLVTDGMKSN